MRLLCLHRRAQFVTRTLACSAADSRFPRLHLGAEDFRHRFVAAVRFQSSDVVPLRKQLKDEAKAKKAVSLESRGKSRVKDVDPRLKDWELTVGIEIHAQLNTARKLFSCMHRGLPPLLDANSLL
jgi:hypothetical protein